MRMSKSGKALTSFVITFFDPFREVVGLIGLEPMTPALSRRCSNQLSYRPNTGRRPEVPRRVGTRSAKLKVPSAKFGNWNLELLIWNFSPKELAKVVEVNGFEPLTFCLQSRRSTN